MISLILIKNENSYYLFLGISLYQNLDVLDILRIKYPIYIYIDNVYSLNEIVN